MTERRVNMKQHGWAPARKSRAKRKI